MIDPLLLTVCAVAVLAAGWTGVLVARDRLPGWYLIGLLGLLELALLVVCVVGLVQLATTSRDVAARTIGAYLVAMLILVPAATLWALVERTRFGTAVIIIACFGVPVMISRVHTLWSATSVG